MGGKKENGKKVGEIVERLKKLGENEDIPMRVTDELNDPYIAKMGYFAKNGRGSFQIRIVYGINTIMKIRNREDFETIKTVINFLERNPQYIDALEELNGTTTLRRKRTTEYI